MNRLFRDSALPVSAWSLVAVGVMHCLAMKFCTVFRRMFSTSGKTPVVALAVIEAVIDVSVEMFRPMEPGSSADKYTA
jgi:hypothetical protein